MSLLRDKLYKLFDKLRGGSTPTRILMLGLYASGKTTILYRMKLNKTVSTTPTTGFNVETVSVMKGVKFNVWDIDGVNKQLWKHWCVNNTEGLIFVVDSSDIDRLEEAREELEAILQLETMREVPLVIIANKQDLPNAMKVSDMIERLRLPQLRDHKWHIQPACATNGDGIWEAMTSMHELVKDFRDRTENQQS